VAEARGQFGEPSEAVTRWLVKTAEWEDLVRAVVKCLLLLLVVVSYKSPSTLQ
jgi:hypothetical protein